MATTHDSFVAFDKLYESVFADIENFFRFARRNPDALSEEMFDDAYYARVAELMKKRIDHEMKYLRSPHLR